MRVRFEVGSAGIWQETLRSKRNLRFIFTICVEGLLYFLQRSVLLLSLLSTSESSKAKLSFTAKVWIHILRQSLSSQLYARVLHVPILQESSPFIFFLARPPETTQNLLDPNCTQKHLQVMNASGQCRKENRFQALPWSRKSMLTL